MYNEDLVVGNVHIKGRALLAPMSGYTDPPFREICREKGATYTPCEMVATQENLRKTRKTASRFKFLKDEYPKVIQLVGADKHDIVSSALYAISCGADMIDFNAGCPAKKVCSTGAGAALLKEPEKLLDILEALVKVSTVPVTLKLRTGWDKEHVNAIFIASQAERLGIQMLTVHGRTATQGLKGYVDFDTIRYVKQSVSIPVVANGDVDGAWAAKDMFMFTGADAVMIGRGALGNPWVFDEINSVIQGANFYAIQKNDIIKTMCRHVQYHLDYYGEKRGLRSIRKHLIWYFKSLHLSSSFIEDNKEITNGKEYISRLEDCLSSLLINK